jgi:hypothetical protein
VSKVAVALIALALSGCLDYVSNPHPGGVMLGSGKITPCHGFYTDDQACGRAKFNAPRVANIHSGMTMNEVRSVMEHDAEQKTIENSSESWGYLTDYEAEKMTWVIFTDGKVTGMKQSPWKNDD